MWDAAFTNFLLKAFFYIKTRVLKINSFCE